MITLRDSEFGQASVNQINPFKKRQNRSHSNIKPKT